MVKAIGLDLCEVSRIRRLLERYGERFIGRVFTEGEASYCRAHADPAVYFAARFAAKEAALKALGTGRGQGVRWRDVEVLRDPRGVPLIALSGPARDRALALGIDRMLVTLTHTASQAAAAVIGEG